MGLILRILLAFIVIAVVAALAAVVARTPGSVTLHWLGYRIDTSVGVLIAAVLLLVALGALLYRIWRAIRNMPGRLQSRHAERRREEGYLAISRGIIALAAGDTGEAKRQARRANDILDRPSGALLIGAQAAQLEGRPGKARQFFEAMLDDPETELMGVRGLLAIAEEGNDSEAALALAERARELNPQTPWALRKVVEHRIASGQWADAESAIVDAMNRKAVTVDQGKRSRATILVQLSVMADRLGHRQQAVERARRAHKLAPKFVPATMQLARLLIDEGQLRAAQRLIEGSWKETPHPDLGRLYRRTFGDADPMQAFKSLEKLETISPRDPVTRLLLARAALDAQLWGITRRHLRQALELGDTAEPNATYCRIMSDLEFGETRDAAAARDWLSRATRAAPDEAWVCDTCGHADADWAAKCPSCGAFDSLDWRRPSWVSAIEAHGEADTETETGHGVVVDASIAPSPPREDAGGGTGNATGGGTAAVPAVRNREAS